MNEVLHKMAKILDVVVATSKLSCYDVQCMYMQKLKIKSQKGPID
jgi:hypothetical protein